MGAIHILVLIYWSAEERNNPINNLPCHLNSLYSDTPRPVNLNAFRMFQYFKEHGRRHLNLLHFTVASHFVWVWNMVSYFKGMTEITNVWQQSAYKNIWTKKGHYDGFSMCLGWEDNIKMDLKEMGCEDKRWTELVQDHVQWQLLVYWCWTFTFCYHRVSYVLLC